MAAGLIFWQRGTRVSPWQAAYRGLMEPLLLDSLDAAAKVRSWEVFIAAPEHQLFVLEHEELVTGYVHIFASRAEASPSTG